MRSNQQGESGDIPTKSSKSNRRYEAWKNGCDGG